MRVLVVHRYFWPDKTSCASIMFRISRQLVTDGHQVDVLTSQPSYQESSRRDRRPRKENLEGVAVTRLSLPTELSRPIWRILNAIHLGLRIILQSLFNRYDVIIVATIPPVLGGFFSAFAAKLNGARFIYYCMDLHPEIGHLSGDFTNSLLLSLLRRMDDWSCRSADPVLVHSKDMRTTLRARPRGDEYNIQIMNNFALPSDENNEQRTDFGFKKNRLTVIYAGNIGRFQGLEVAADAMALIFDRKDIELVLMGDGVAKANLAKRVQDSQANVRFVSYKPVSCVKIAVRQADLGLVMLSPDVYKFAYPSKIMAYLEQGRPIIAVVEPESELVQEMRSQAYGFVSPVGDARALAALFIELADDDSWRDRSRAAASHAYERNFAPEVVLSRWTRLVRGEDVF